MVWWLLALAGAAELQCELRGLPVRIVYETSGQVVVYDGDEVLAEADGGPMVVDDVRATCLGDRFRLVRGGNVAADGDHATLSVGTMEIDLGPMLDLLPSERFDRRLAALRRMRRAAGAAEWEKLDEHQSQLAPLEAGERSRLAEVLLQQGSRPAIERAWKLLAPAPASPLREEAGLTLLRSYAAEGQLDEVVAVAEGLEGVDEACEWLGRVPWSQGRKAKARKQWATCGELSEEARDWCGPCR